MYLSRLELRTEATANRRFWADLEDLYGAHQAIWQLFSDGAARKRDFLFRKEGEGAGARWLTLSAREPRDGRGFWKVECKPFSPRLAVGDRLRFLVRVNPTVAKSREGRSSARHDVVMNEKRRLPAGAGERPEPAIVHSACGAWLQARSERHGFALDTAELAVDGYRQLGGRRPGDLRVSVVDLDGVLTVQDPERFTTMLFQGLGPAKSFGCGLMLVRRA